MPTVLPPNNSELVGAGSTPDNAMFRAGIEKFLNYSKNLLGVAGTSAAARTALEMPSNIAVNYALNTDYEINQRNYASESGGAGVFYRDCWYGGVSGFNLLLGTAAGDLNQKVYLPSDGIGRNYTISWSGTNVVRKNGVVITSPHTFTSAGGGTPILITQEFGGASPRTLITNLLFEPGAIATQWPKPERVSEMSKCQRFCYPVNDCLGITITTANVGSPNIRFPVEMAAIPTIEGTPTFSASVGSNGTPAISVVSQAAATKRSIYIFNSANNWTVGALIQLNAVFVAS